MRNRVFLDLVLYPHRSLSPEGFGWLMLALGAIALTLGMIFFLAGAWPVLGFLGLDLLLLYLAFRANYRQARSYETVRLTERALTVERVSPDGRVQRWELPPQWLRVDMDAPAEDGGHLHLISRERSLVLGAFLPPGEREELADKIREALAARADTPATVT